MTYNSRDDMANFILLLKNNVLIIKSLIIGCDKDEIEVLNILAKYYEHNI